MIEIMKKILMIPYLFPPIEGPRSIRMSYIANYLCKWDWNVDVLSVYYNNCYKYDKSLLKILSSKINIHRCYNGPLDALKHLFCIKQLNSKTLLGFSKFISSLKMKLLIPDSNVSWLPFAVLRGANLIAKNKYDIIFTSSFPYSSHIVGYILKKLYKIPWVAEFSDPWSFNPINKPLGLKFIVNKELEELILKETDGLVFMTDETKQLYLEKFDFLQENKALVIPSGYEPKDYPDNVNNFQNKFTILYAGTIGKRINILKSFFKAVNYLASTIDDFNKDYEVLLIGNIGKEVIPFLTKKIVSIGYVDFLESLDYMKRSCVLLLLGNEGNVQIPSKVYNYLGAKIPILAILGNEYDPLKNLLKGINRVIIVNDSEKEIAESLAHLYSLFKSEMLFKSFDFSDIEQFTWKYLLKSLDSLLKKVMGVC